jgi:osmotically-inducible protein OsmY
VVQDGWVPFEGEVDWHFQREVAEADVRKLSGVLGATNIIAIKQAVQTADVRKRIEDALKRRAEVEATKISINVLGNGAVKLEGKVDSWDERRAVKRAAWSAPGVRTVDDRISIGR